MHTFVSVPHFIRVAILMIFVEIDKTGVIGDQSQAICRVNLTALNSINF